MSDSLAKTLPSRREIDLEIEHLHGFKPLAKNAYRMAPPKLVELRRQLDELSATMFIYPAKTPYRPPCYFRRRMMRRYISASTTEL